MRKPLTPPLSTSLKDTFGSSLELGAGSLGSSFHDKPFPEDSEAEIKMSKRCSPSTGSVNDMNTVQAVRRGYD